MTHPFLSDKQHAREAKALCSKPVRAFETLAPYIWWVMAWAVMCFIGFAWEHASYEKDAFELQNLLEKYTVRKEDALALNSRYKLEVQSQSDPAWIELVLLKGLGLVPEGQTKVFFKND